MPEPSYVLVSNLVTSVPTRATSKPDLALTGAIPGARPPLLMYVYPAFIGEALDSIVQLRV
jgi:hypothetical protein